MKIRMKPCPFCGGDAVLLGCGHGSRVECTICHAGTKWYLHKNSTDEVSDMMAIEAWNRRVKNALLKEQEPVVPLTIDDAVSEIMDKHYKRLKEESVADEDMCNKNK